MDLMDFAFPALLLGFGVMVVLMFVVARRVSLWLMNKRDEQYVELQLRQQMKYEELRRKAADKILRQSGERR